MTNPFESKPDLSRDQRIGQVVARYRDFLAENKAPEIEQLTEKFPDLMPDIQRELNKVRMIHAAMQQAGASHDSSGALSKQAGVGAREQQGSDTTSQASLDTHSKPSIKPQPIVDNSPAAAMQRLGQTEKKGRQTPTNSQSPLPSKSKLPPPDELRMFGDYELLEELGRGGMGVVYKAHQRSLKRIVAVKMILAGTLASDEELRRFQIEAQAAAALHHPNIVQIYEIGEHNGTPYFSMAYVEGQGLDSVIREHPLPALKAAEYVQKLAAAMSYAHGLGVLHRDLKPANVIVDTNGDPHITDFGLAKRVGADSTMTVTGQILGTPSFMPPEQALAQRGEVDQRSDVYSLGAILYTLLVGKPPFKGATLAETLLQVATDTPELPSHRQTNIPSGIEAVCMKCLQKRKEARYESAAALSEDLSRFCRGEPVAAVGVRPQSKARAPVSKRKLNTIVAVALCFLFLSICTVFVIVRTQGDDEAKHAGTLERESDETVPKRVERLPTKPKQPSASPVPTTTALVISPVEHQTVQEGEKLEVAIKLEETPDAAVHYRVVSSSEDGVSIDRETGILTWVPTENQGGKTCNVVVEAVADAGRHSPGRTSLSIQALEGNARPTIAAVPPQTAQVGHAIRVDLHATDTDVPKQELRYTTKNAPEGLKVDRDTGVLTWTPTRSQAGAEHVVSVSVSDGLGETETPIKISVKPTFQPHSIDPNELRLAGGGDPSRVSDALVAIFGSSRQQGSLRFSPNGQFVLVSDHCFELASGKVVLGTPALSVARFSPDSKTLVAVERESAEIVRWDLMTGREIGRTRPATADRTLYAAINRTCTQVARLQITLAATGRPTGEPTISLVSVSDGRQEQRTSLKWRRYLGYTEDGKYITSLMRRDQGTALEKWDIAAETRQELFFGSCDPLFTVAGRILFSNGFNEKLTFYDVISGRSKHFPRVEGTCISISSDGQQIASVVDGVVEVRDASSNTIQLRIDSELSAPTATLFSEGRDLLGVTYADGFLIWNLKDNREVYRKKFQSPLRDLVFAAEGDVAITLSDLHVERWSLESGRILSSQAIPPLPIAATRQRPVGIGSFIFNPLGDATTTTYSVAHVNTPIRSHSQTWKLDSGAVEYLWNGDTTLHGRRFLISDDERFIIGRTTDDSQDVASVIDWRTLKRLRTVSPMPVDGSLELFGPFAYRESKLWDLSSGAQLKTNFPQGIRAILDISNDGKLIALCTDTSTVVCQTDTFKVVWTANFAAERADFSATGRSLAIWHRDRANGTWHHSVVHISTGRSQPLAAVEHGLNYGEFKFSPDESIVMDLGRSRGTVKAIAAVWNRESGKLIWTPASNSQFMRSALSADCSKLSYFDDKNVLHVVRTKDGTVETSIQIAEGIKIKATRLSRDGAFVATLNENGTAFLFHLVD